MESSTTVTFQEILARYRAMYDELHYQNICQQLAIKHLEAKVVSLEAQLKTPDTPA